ncbi:hypothetical protein EV363DRAFT_1295732 [Boletus edulis]|nr:hypothetical protein EV363DRAFT_1295732 [Boletus edulis]
MCPYTRLRFATFPVARSRTPRNLTWRAHAYRNVPIHQTPICAHGVSRFGIGAGPRATEHNNSATRRACPAEFARTIHPGMRVAFGNTGTTVITDVLTPTHQMMDTPTGDITPLGTKIIISLDDRDRPEGERKSEKIQAELLPGAHPVLAPALIGTQKNVMLMIDHTFKMIADVLTLTHQMMDTPAGDTPLGTKIILGLGITMMTTLLDMGGMEDIVNTKFCMSSLLVV